MFVKLVNVQLGNFFLNVPYIVTHRNFSKKMRKKMCYASTSLRDTSFPIYNFSNFIGILQVKNRANLCIFSQFKMIRFYCGSTFTDSEEEKALQEAEDSFFTEDYLKPVESTVYLKEKKKLKNVKSSSELYYDPDLDDQKNTSQLVIRIIDAQTGITSRMSRMDTVISRAQRIDSAMGEMKDEHALITHALLELNMPHYKKFIAAHNERCEQYAPNFINFLKDLNPYANINTTEINNLFVCEASVIKILENSITVGIIDFIRLLLTKRLSLEKKVVNKFKKIKREIKNFNLKSTTVVPAVDDVEFLAYETSMDKARSIKYLNNYTKIQYTVKHKYYKDLFDHLQHTSDCLYDILSTRFSETEMLNFKGIDSFTLGKYSSLITDYITKIASTETDFILNDLFVMNVVLYKNIAETLNRFNFNLYLAKKNKIEFCKKNILFKHEPTREEKKLKKEFEKQNKHVLKLLARDKKRQDKIDAKWAKLTPRQRANRLRKLEEAIAAVLGPSSKDLPKS